MSRRNHKILWEQLKVLVLYSPKQRYSRKDLYHLMSELEAGQLCQDPINELDKMKEGGIIDG